MKSEDKTLVWVVGILFGSLAILSIAEAVTTIMTACP